MDQHQLVSRWIQGNVPGKILPWQIDLDTTNVCNQSCYYCNSDQFRQQSPTHQDVSSYLQLISQLSTWKSVDPNVVGNINNVIFSGGGEPTLLTGYESIVEKSIDSGFVCAMNTNGAKLHKLLKIPGEKLKRMAYIGLDIDSADQDTYEKIRRSKSQKSPFDEVVEVAAALGKINAPLDLKALLMPENTSEYEINKLFELAHTVNARSVHLRPIVLNDIAFVIDYKIKSIVDVAAKKYNVNYSIAMGRYDTRTYKRCHQMFLFPSFCADGNIYLCCEYKGREDLKLGSWLDRDWRADWCSAKHREIYLHFKTTFCKPCRPNSTNNKIEFSIRNPNSISTCFI